MYIKKQMSHVVKDTGILLVTAGTPYFMYLKEFSPLLTFGTAFLGFVAMSFKFAHDFHKYVYKPYISKKEKSSFDKDDFNKKEMED